MVKQKVKDSRIELLRIMSIIIIIFHHLSEYGIVRYADGSIWSQGSAINRIIAAFMLPGGEIGVALFFMITGYFCIYRSERRSVKTVVSTTLFYAIITLVFCCVYYLVDHSAFQEYTMNELFRMAISLCFNPITGSTWWFVAAYVFLVVLMPDINRLYGALSHRKKIIAIAFICVFWYGAGRYGSSFYILYKAIFFYLIGGYFQTEITIKEPSKIRGGGVFAYCTPYMVNICRRVIRFKQHEQRQFYAKYGIGDGRVVLQRSYCSD